MSVKWQFIRNKINNFSFEKESNTESGCGSLWTKVGTPTLSREVINKKHGSYSQKIIGSSSGDGISQIFDVSDILTTGFGLKFYAYIVSGTLSIEIEALDSNEDSLGTLFLDTYTSNAELELFSETFDAILSGVSEIPYMKITISQSGATALTAYIDTTMVYENTNVTVDINPTTFSYDKVSNAVYEKDIEGFDIRIQPLELSRRTFMDGMAPTWAYLTQTQKDLFENLVGEEVVIIDHIANLYWVDIMKINVQFIERQVPALYATILEFKEVRR